jgi:hypothetical protein
MAGCSVAQDLGVGCGDDFRSAGIEVEMLEGSPPVVVDRVEKVQHLVVGESFDENEVFVEAPQRSGAPVPGDDRELEVFDELFDVAVVAGSEENYRLVEERPAVRCSRPDPGLYRGRCCERNDRPSHGPRVRLMAESGQSQEAMA